VHFDSPPAPKEEFDAIEEFEASGSPFSGAPEHFEWQSKIPSSVQVVALQSMVLDGHGWQLP
jgi:hypothetical protein